MESLYPEILPLMSTTVQRTATALTLASGLPITARISLVSSQKIESSCLTALPVHMDTMVAFREDPLV